MKVYRNIFTDITAPESLFAAWRKFRLGKSKREDVQNFERDLEQNIFDLSADLLSGEYRHSPYKAFNICDPKPRRIHKATVRDRLVHQALYDVLNPIFEPTFIAHSFSSRLDKGTHKAVAALSKALRQVSQNHTQPCFVLKCDIRKFFDSVDHSTLLTIICRRVKDDRVIALIREIIASFDGYRIDKDKKAGLPIGNLTSQLFANVYLNELDQFAKHQLREQHYFRYADDFAIIADSESHLQNLIRPLAEFLGSRLKMRLHPHKVSVRKLRQGIDFLGYVVLPYHRLLRSNTKRRMLKKLNKTFGEHLTGLKSEEDLTQVFASYFGLISHADSFHLASGLRNRFWLSK